MSSFKFHKSEQFLLLFLLALSNFVILSPLFKPSVLSSRLTGRYSTAYQYRYSTVVRLSSDFSALWIFLLLPLLNLFSSNLTDFLWVVKNSTGNVTVVPILKTHQVPSLPLQIVRNWDWTMIKLYLSTSTYQITSSSHEVMECYCFLLCDQESSFLTWNTECNALKSSFPGMLTAKIVTFLTSALTAMVGLRMAVCGCIWTGDTWTV